MATYTCSGSGNWNAAATWGGAGVPVAGDTAIINNAAYTVTLTANAACQNLTVSAGTLACANFICVLSATSGGTITLGGTVTAGTGYLQVHNSCTFNCAGTKIQRINIALDSTITLTAKFLADTFFFRSSIYVYFEGAYDVEIDNFNMDANRGFAINFRLKEGQSLIINTSMYMNGSNGALAKLYSKTASSTIYLKYYGTAADCCISLATFVDVDASSSVIPIYNWYGSTLTRTSNITNVTSVSLGYGTKARSINQGGF